MAKSQKSWQPPAPRPRIVLGVPGAWRDRSEAQQELARRHRLLCAGEASVLVNLDDPDAEDPLVVEVQPPDPTLRRNFELAGEGELPAELLERIGAHTLTLYLVDEEGGSRASAERLLTTAVKLLDVGGLAVKVETAGLAHPPGRWRELAARGDVGATLYHAFVARHLDPDARSCASSGMHALGLPDATTAAGGHALETLDAFLQYVVVEQPDLRPGHTFAPSPDGPRWRLELGPDGRFEPEHPLRNPFGLWTLTRA